MPSPQAPPPSGYGPRDPATEGDGRLPRPGDVLRGRIGIGVTGVAMGAFLWGPLIEGLSREGLPAEGQGPWPLVASVLVGAALTAPLILQGFWWLLAPLVRFDRDRIRVRFLLWRGALDIAAEDVVWRPGCRYVGRHLLVTGPRPARLPLFLLRRSHQERLFAWLDAAAAARAVRGPGG